MAHLIFSEVSKVLLCVKSVGDIDSYKARNHQFYSDLKRKVKIASNLTIKPIDHILEDLSEFTSYDVIISGFIFPFFESHTRKILGKYNKLLRIGGILYLSEPTVAVEDICLKNLRTESKLIQDLKLSGFISVNLLDIKNIDTEKDYDKKILNLDKIRLLQIKAYKPEYEIGASIPLIVSLKADACASQPLDHEFLDEDDLLDENDRQKPDPPLLPECGPRSLKKRACKNCTCGFDKKQDGPNEETGQATTSCGNCYLGDAFRCSTCPYLGLPAFEPGQKVILSANQLRSDFD